MRTGAVWPRGEAQSSVPEPSQAVPAGSWTPFQEAPEAQLTTESRSTEPTHAAVQGARVTGRPWLISSRCVKEA